MISKKSKIFLSGHKGLVGSAILKKLKEQGYKNIITRTREQLDLRNQKKVLNFFKKNNFAAVINAAAKVGGIHANNKYRADFIFDNLSIQNNIVYSSFLTKVKRLIFLGSSCVYPRSCKQPIKEEYLLTGSLEKTNEPYAIAKIAGIKLCENFNKQYRTNYLCLMPCNIYGPNDNYHKSNSHFFPSLIVKIHDAIKKKKSTITLWGSGKPKREMLYSEDLAEAVLFFLNKKTKENLINIGSSNELTIQEYAKFIIKNLGASLKINYDRSMMDGTPRKILDSSIARKYGWKPKHNLKEGFERTYNQYVNKFKNKKVISVS
jgi:GDP-L-fucose synthase